MRRRDAAWSAALGVRSATNEPFVEFNDLWMLEEDLRLSSDDARPWQMAGITPTKLL